MIPIDLNNINNIVQGNVHNSSKKNSLIDEELCTVIYDIAPVSAPNGCKQSDLLEKLLPVTQDKDFMEKVYQNSKINERYLFYNTLDLELAKKTADERVELFQELVQDAIIKAAEKVIEQSKIDKNNISYVVGVTSTGICAPSIEATVIRKLGLPSTTGRTMINFMGCGASVIATRTAMAHSKLKPGTYVLIVAIEASSLSMNEDFTSRNSIVTQCIFSDGCVASLVTTQPRSKVQGKFEILDERTYMMNDTESALHMTLGSTGVNVSLSPELSSGIQKNILGATNEFLANNKLTIKDIDFWAVHPGGRKILEAVQSGLKLYPEELCESYEVMRKYGNMVSCSAFFVLRRCLMKNTIYRDEGNSGYNHGIMMAFSPGASIETILYKYVN